MHGMEVDYYKKLFQTIGNIIELIEKDDIPKYLLCQNSTWWTPLLWNPFSKQSMECPSLLTWKNTVWSWHRICCCRKINLFRKLPPLWDIKAKVNLHRLSEIYFRYYLLHIRNCIVINNFNAKLHPQYPWVQFCINQYSNVSPSSGISRTSILYKCTFLFCFLQIF